MPEGPGASESLQVTPSLQSDGARHRLLQSLVLPGGNVGVGKASRQGMGCMVSSMATKKNNNKIKDLEFIIGNCFSLNSTAK